MQYVHSICNLRSNVPKEIPVIFHNGLNYDYYFTMKKLGNEFKGQFGCLAENTKKYKTFSVPIAKEMKKVDKDGKEDVKTVSYKINLLIVQDLWQVPYQILLIISQMEFIKLNGKIAIVFLNMKVSLTI